jgi:hypothetical protein
MNPDNSHHDQPYWSDDDLVSLHKEVISLRVRGLNQVIKEGRDHLGLLRIARERGMKGLPVWALRDLLREATLSITAAEEYHESMEAEYGLRKTFGKPYMVRREEARKLLKVSKSAWEKYHEPQMAQALTEAVLELRNRQPNMASVQTTGEVPPTGAPESPDFKEGDRSGSDQEAANISGLQSRDSQAIPLVSHYIWLRLPVSILDQQGITTANLGSNQIDSQKELALTLQIRIEPS